MTKLHKMASMMAVSLRCIEAAPILPYTCRQCLFRRSFSSTSMSLAGHNKWSKTKHLKAVTDKKKQADRTLYSRAISMYSRMYGDDLSINPQLANAIAMANKASIPKSVIETAIARGQGRSTTGAKLEPMTFEILMPPNIALIVEAESESKLTTLQNVRQLVKKHGGVSGSTAFYFVRRGRAVFASKEGGPSLSDVMEEALEHEGVEDVEELPEGGFLVWTEPARVTAVTGAVADKFAFEVLESDIVWTPNEDTVVGLDDEEVATNVGHVAAGLKEYTEIKAVYANVRDGGLPDQVWARIEDNLDS